MKRWMLEELTIKHINFFLFLVLGFCFWKASDSFATTYTFYPRQDTYIDGTTTGPNNFDKNFGLNTNLRVQTTTNVLVSFSQDELGATLGTQHIVSATLQLYLETNFNNWGSGAYIDVHRLSIDWLETGATWNCSNDADTSNSTPDCDDIWLGGYYEEYVSDSLLHQNSQTGWKNYDVTSDVQVFQNGISDYGWLIRKKNYSDVGSLDYTSIQGTPSQIPRLVVVVDDQTCTPTSIDSVSPGWIINDGSQNTIEVTGDGLQNITKVLRNGSSIAYTFSPDTLTFTEAASSTQTDTIQFNSNCISSPLPLFTIESVPPGYGPEGSVVCGSPGNVTKFARGHVTGEPNKYLCYGTTGSMSVVKLIGNGLPELTSDDGAYTNNGTAPTCMTKNVFPCQNSSPDTTNTNFFKNARYFTHGGGGHGSNMVRLWVSGHSNNSMNGTESMPFQLVPNNLTTGKYIIKANSSSGPALEPRYINRLKQVLTEANNNGQTVILSLFDHDVFVDPTLYFFNPWSPRSDGISHNNLGLSCQLPFANIPQGVIAATQFYDICTETPATGNSCGTDATGKYKLKCLGWSQKNLVDKIIDVVKTGNNGTYFKNVIFEVANEAAQKKLGMNGWTVNIDKYKTWYKTVAKWIKDRGKYMVVVNPGPEDYSSDPSQKFIFDSDCVPSSCTNQYSVVKDTSTDKNVDMLALHGHAWSDFPEGSSKQYDPCKLANRAVSNFGKPVMIDDDGIAPFSARYNNDNVKTYATDATSTSCKDQNNIPLGTGIVHYDHLEEGQHLPISNCMPSGEPTYIDCWSYDRLGDISPFSDLCALSGTCTTLNEGSQACIVKGCYSQ